MSAMTPEQLSAAAASYAKREKERIESQKPALEAFIESNIKPWRDKEKVEALWSSARDEAARRTQEYIDMLYLDCLLTPYHADYGFGEGKFYDFLKLVMKNVGLECKNLHDIDESWNYLANHAQEQCNSLVGDDE